MSYYRQIRRPVAVFVDTIDEYFEGYVDSGDPSEADTSYLRHNKDSRIWIVDCVGAPQLPRSASAEKTAVAVALNQSGLIITTTVL